MPTPPCNPDDLFARADALFDGALDLDPADRGTYVDQACGDDVALRAAVHTLLKAHDESARFLSGSAMELAARLVNGMAEGADELPAPERLGPFRVGRELGHGGMGAVYLGERDDGQFAQRVALKLVRGGLGADYLVRRFLEERRILATLEHPCIARLVDGGLTADGVPWFAMEYVDGQRIDQYCAERKLSLEDRLRVFRDVCDAVDYAHRMRVVHRDLKPANILVLADGSVKLLDFGVARLLVPDAEDSDGTPTVTAFQALTPEYAPPEQLRGEPATTASDVYSLGVLLYELLVGERPYTLRGHSAADIERVVCGTEPPHPSVAARRRGGVAGERDWRRLRGDLDTIAMKALRKDPARRYQSAGTLLEDLHRFSAGQRVLARPDTIAYRARRVATKHRRAIAATAGFAALTAVFAVLLTMQARGSLFGTNFIPLPGRPVMAPGVIAVGPVRFAGGGSDDSIAAALPEMLSTELGRVSGLEVIRRARLQELRARAVDQRAAAALAGASQVVEGELHTAGVEGYRFEFRRVDARSGRIYATHTVVAAEAPELANRAAAVVARSFGLREPPPLQYASGSVPARALYEHGLRSLYREGDPRKARDLFVAAIEMDSGFAMAALFGALTASAAHDPEQSFALLKRADALADNAPDRDRLWIRAHVANAMNEPRGAALAETLAMRYPSDPAAANLIGGIQTWTGRYLEAVDSHRRALTLEPLSRHAAPGQCHACEAYAGLINAYQAADSFAAAVRSAREWIAVRPDNVTAWWHLARLFEAMDRPDDAATAWRQLAVLSPGHETVRFSDAHRGIRAGEFAVADEALAAAARSADAAVAREALWWQVVSLRNQRRFAEAWAAATAYRMVATTSRHAVHPFATPQAIVLTETGSGVRAAAMFDSMFHSLPPRAQPRLTSRDQAWLLTLRASALAASGDTAALPRLADSVQAIGALSANGRDPRLHHHIRGLLLRARGDLPGAEREFRRAISSTTLGYTRTNVELADVLVRQSRPREAISLLRASLRTPLDGAALYVTRTDVHEALGRAFEGAGQLDSAAAYYRRVLRESARADPAVAPSVADVRARVRMLEVAGKRRKRPQTTSEVGADQTGRTSVR